MDARGEIGAEVSTYRVHRFDLKMTKDAGNLERFLNSLEGEVVSVVPNVTMKAVWVHVVNFVYVIERLPEVASDRLED
jgi:hypothetical protein